MSIVTIKCDDKIWKLHNSLISKEPSSIFMQNASQESVWFENTNNTVFELFIKQSHAQMIVDYFRGYHVNYANLSVTDLHNLFIDVERLNMTVFVDKLSEIHIIPIYATSDEIKSLTQSIVGIISNYYHGNMDVINYAKHIIDSNSIFIRSFNNTEIFDTTMLVCFGMVSCFITYSLNASVDVNVSGLLFKLLTNDISLDEFIKTLTANLFAGNNSDNNNDNNNDTDDINDDNNNDDNDINDDDNSINDDDNSINDEDKSSYDSDEEAYNPPANLNIGHGHGYGFSVQNLLDIIGLNPPTNEEFDNTTNDLLNSINGDDDNEL